MTPHDMEQGNDGTGSEPMWPWLRALLGLVALLLAAHALPRLM